MQPALLVPLARLGLLAKLVPLGKLALLALLEPLAKPEPPA